MRISGKTAACDALATEQLSETSEPDVSTTVALGPQGVTPEMDGNGALVEHCIWGQSSQRYEMCHGSVLHTLYTDLKT